jgi:hypothetical protein
MDTHGYSCRWIEYGYTGRWTQMDKKNRGGRERERERMQGDLIRFLLLFRICGKEALTAEGHNSVKTE